MKPLQILLSTYNGVKYLRELLDSLLAQRYPDFEILVRDDGSTDTTPAILSEYATRDPRIKVLRGDNVGVVASFFELLKSSSEAGEYFALCDQDDVWFEEKLAQGVNALESVLEKGIPLLYCSAVLVTDERLKILGKSPVRAPIPSFNNALVENISTGCTTIINKAARDLILRRLPDPSRVIMHDWWIYIAVSAFGRVIYDDRPGVFYRQHSSNLVGIKFGLSRWVTRVKRFLRRSNVPLITLQATEFGRLFGEDLDPDKRRILRRFLESRKTFWKRLGYCLGKEVVRQNPVDDLVLRALILLNRL